MFVSGVGNTSAVQLSFVGKGKDSTQARVVPAAIDFLSGVHAAVFQ